MYIPKHFKVEDKEFIYDVIKENSFATLFTQHNGEPYATHLPLLLDEDYHVLYGHFARANEQWKDACRQNILAVFHGPHCYISPSWYETMQAVPTWNYVSVHVYGKMEIIEDQEMIFQSFQNMIEKYESPDSFYDMNDLDERFMHGMMKGIVGFKINITKIEAKAKLSQNHSKKRQQLVTRKLEKTSDQDNQKIAELMRKNVP